VNNDLPEMFQDLSLGKGTSGRIHGVVPGVVSDVQDPEKRGRVKVKFPWLLDNKGREYVTDWARVVAPGAGGDDRGLLIPLAPADEVLVAFQFGNVEQPYVLGGLWNKETDKPPTFGGSEGVDLDKRVFKSASGHAVVLDDKKDAEKVVIVDKGGKNQILFEPKDGKVTITAEKQLTISVGDKVTITAKDDGTVSVQCDKFEVRAQTEYALAAGASNVKGASSSLALKSGKVTINDDALEVT
jgi:uncharacterized protein involved in type VI secretion and phage assembly